MRSLSGPGLLVFAVMCPGGAQAAAWAEGIWAQSARQCADKEGPNSRTLIDLSDSKTGPLFDQYENHCRIIDMHPSERGAVLRLSCHEFWDDFEARRDARRVTLTLYRGPGGKLLINGRRFQRCKN
jgi:hypothetical protein